MHRIYVTPTSRKNSSVHSYILLCVYLFSLRVVCLYELSIDAEMAAVIAGIYGRVRPNPYQGAQEFDFERYGIFAALFAIGSIGTRPTLVETVSPKVNGIYIGFMLLPFILVFIVLSVALAFYRTRLPIPKQPWELMVFGKGEAEIPQMDSTTGEYPKQTNSLKVGLVKDESSKLSRLTVVKDEGEPTAGNDVDEPEIAVEPTNTDSEDSSINANQNDDVEQASKESADSSGIWCEGNRASLQ